MFEHEVRERLTRLETRQSRIIADLAAHQVEEGRHHEEVREQLLALRTEHVIVRAGATTIVKVAIWSAAIVSGAVAAWHWLGQHIRWQP